MRKEPFKLGFSGSRQWGTARGGVDAKLLEDIKSTILNIFTIAQQHHPRIEIHVGDASGVDFWVLELAVAHNLHTFVYGAHGKLRVPTRFASKWADLFYTPVLPAQANDPKRGYLIRDEILVDSVDMIYGLWNGYSNGTRYTLDYAKKQGVRSHLLKITSKGIEALW
jgi:hypothetical protein